MKKQSPQKGKTKKRHTLGFEVEFFIIDKKTGAVVHSADKILKRLNEVSPGHKHNFAQEISQNLLEVHGYPDIDGADAMTTLLESVKSAVYVADELGFALLPVGTYPGKFKSSLRRDRKYKPMRVLFGQRTQISGRCAGYHCHNSLPIGVFDTEKFMLKEKAPKKALEKLINAYNIMIAVDPALTTFMQSSPFYQQQYVVKDTRLIVYRGDRALDSLTGSTLTNPSHFGELPSYEQSAADLRDSIRKRYNKRMTDLKTAGVPKKDLPKYKSFLSTNWTPVKINIHGTLEQRGMDMNHLPIVFSASILIWRILHYIQERSYNVVVHDSAIREPFKLKGKTIYIPPYVHVREHLQKLSALKGLESDEIYTYCKRLVALVKQLDGEKVQWLLKPLETMLEERETTSDRIIAQAKSFGHKDMKKPLPQKIAAEIAKTHSKQMFADIVLLQKMIEGNEKLTS